MNKKLVPGIMLVAMASVALVGYKQFTRRTPAGENAVKSQVSAIVQAPTTKPTTIVKELSWRDIETDDYQTYVKNLRQIGCPEATVEDIVVADVNLMFLEKAKPTLEKMKDDLLAYYKGAPKPEAKKQIISGIKSELESLDKQRLAFVPRVVGHEPAKFKTVSAPWGYMLDEIAADDLQFLPPEKRAKVAALRATMKANRDKQVPIGEKMKPEGYVYLDETRVALAKELSEILTPDEFMDYMVHNSDEAQILNWRIQNIETTGDEYRQLLRATMEYYKDGLFVTMDGKYRDTTPKDAQLETAYKSIMGDDRFETYTRENDARYQVTRSFSQEVALPPEEARKLFEIRRQIENSVRSTQLSLAEGPARDQQVKAIAEAGELELNRILTNEETRARFYKVSAGAWLGRIRKYPSESPLPIPTSPPMLVSRSR